MIVYSDLGCYKQFILFLIYGRVGVYSIKPISPTRFAFASTRQR